MDLEETKKGLVVKTTQRYTPWNIPTPCGGGITKLDDNGSSMRIILMCVNYHVNRSMSNSLVRFLFFYGAQGWGAIFRDTEIRGFRVRRWMGTAQHKPPSSLSDLTICK